MNAFWVHVLSIPNRSRTHIYISTISSSMSIYGPLFFWGCVSFPYRSVDHLDFSLLLVFGDLGFFLLQFLVPLALLESPTRSQNCYWLWVHICFFLHKWMPSVVSLFSFKFLETLLIFLYLWSEVEIVLVKREVSVQVSMLVTLATSEGYIFIIQ